MGGELIFECWIDVRIDYECGLFVVGVVCFVIVVVVTYYLRVGGGVAKECFV